MNGSLLKYTIWQPLLAAGLIVICVAIRPAGLTANDGLSYFGGFLNTVVPYSLAFALIGLSWWQLAAHTAERVTRRALQVLACLVMGVIVTPHQIVDPIHTAFGAALFALQLVLVGYWAYSQRRAVAGLAGVIMLISGLLCLAYLPNKHGWLLEFQIIYQAAFAVSLYEQTLRSAI